jgi:glutamate-ammonia-ligase adenylyltransferase
LFSGSQALSTLLISQPDLLSVLAPEELRYPRRKEGLLREVARWLEPLVAAKDYAAAFRQIRTLKQVEMLRIAARDLARFGKVPELTRELSDLADVCLETTWRLCLAQHQDRYGSPWQEDPQREGGWDPTRGCVLGMGKLGGQELNYSSDVDVLFVYSGEGSVFKQAPAKGRAPRQVMSNHQFFNRVAEAFIGEVSRMTPEGTLYRIDLRLRPEGEGGPLSRSLDSYENYYAQWGQTWERMMLMKTRGVAGDGLVAAEFLEMIQSFRYPRSMNSDVLREVAEMKDRIEKEVVKSGQLDSNVKLGRGGIREVEFIVQSLQLLHAGRQPFLQTSQTLPGLEKLTQYLLLESDEARALAEGYVFLRDVEHRLQMEDNQQTHTIPANRQAQERLARLMGFGKLPEFEAARKKLSGNIRRIFVKMLRAERGADAAASPFPRQFEGEEAAWKQLLQAHGFRDTDKALHVLQEFVEGPGYVHVSQRTSELALALLPRLFALCPKLEEGDKIAPARRASVPSEKARAPLSDPDRVVTRLDNFITAYGARGTLFELWHGNPTIFELLALLFDRSEFLAELAIRTPDLVDELVVSGRLRQRKTAPETLRDLRHGLGDPDQHLWLRKYHQVELMRIGLRDILGLGESEQYLTELSALADASLQYAVEAVVKQHRLKKPPFTIVGLGKLGGSEIDYGSDLDILFVADSTSKDLRRLSKLALEVLDLISTRTEHGLTFQTDARLRPDGEKGILVNTLKGYEDYYRQRAMLWEIHSLTRTRTVAGDLGLGKRFQELAAKLTDFRQPPKPLAAFSSDWKQKIHQMRLRIEKERTPQGKDALAIKTGAGGLVDAEFLAQALCLENGWQEPNTLAALQRAEKENLLPDAAPFITNYRLLRRVEGILRRWSYEGETVLPDDPAPYYRVAVRCDYPSAEAFREAVAQARAKVRAVYINYFLPSSRSSV